MLGKQPILSTRRADPSAPLPVPQPGMQGPTREEIHALATPASFQQTRIPEPTMPSASQPGEPAVEPKRLAVGSGVRLKGAAIEDCDTLIVEGQVEATIDCRSLQIASDGVYRGKATVDTAEIQGSFEGELEVRERLVLRSGGHILGKICYGKLLVEEGGVIGGEITTLEAEQEKRNQNGGLKRIAPAIPVATVERSVG